MDIVLTAPKLGKVRGTVGQVAEELNNAKLVVYFSGDSICLGFMAANAPKENKGKLVCFYDQKPEIGEYYVDYGKGFYSVHPSCNSTGFGEPVLFTTVTPAAHKLIDTFIDSCVEILREIIATDGEGETYTVTIRKGDQVEAPAQA